MSPEYTVVDIFPFRCMSCGGFVASSREGFTTNVPIFSLLFVTLANPNGVTSIKNCSFDRPQPLLHGNVTSHVAGSLPKRNTPVESGKTHRLSRGSEPSGRFAHSPSGRTTLSRPVRTALLPPVRGSLLLNTPKETISTRGRFLSCLVPRTGVPGSASSSVDAALSSVDVATSRVFAFWGLGIWNGNLQLYTSTHRSSHPISGFLT